jgi:hypothetical protein
MKVSIDPPWPGDQADRLGAVVLNDEPFRKMQKEKEFDDWLDDRLLS